MPWTTNVTYSCFGGMNRHYEHLYAIRSPSLWHTTLENVILLANMQSAAVTIPYYLVWDGSGNLVLINEELCLAWWPERLGTYSMDSHMHLIMDWRIVFCWKQACVYFTFFTIFCQYVYNKCLIYCTLCLWSVLLVMSSVHMDSCDLFIHILQGCFTHYDDVIMDAIASQITSLASVYSDV